MDWTFKATDVVIVFATLMGPVLAVQAQKWLERATEASRRRHQLFFTLMSTRRTRLAPEHVQALNSIQLLFGRKNSDRNIINKWEEYLDKLVFSFDGKTEAEITNWNVESDTLFIQLVHKISQRLGYDFTELQIRKGVYRPTGHQNVESDQLAILSGLATVFTKGQPLPLQLVVPEEAVALQAEVQRSVIAQANPDRVMKVKIVPE